MVTTCKVEPNLPVDTLPAAVARLRTHFFGLPAKEDLYDESLVALRAPPSLYVAHLRSARYFGAR
jgi:hypothetical protein